jgi:hypothetical protein
MTTESKKTLIIGATDKPERYAYRALHMLKAHGHAVEGISRRAMQVSGVYIQKGKPTFEYIHTVTLYLSAGFQAEYYDYIIQLKPERVIFNPGTENPELYSILDNHGIAYENACTLVMLSTNQY